MDTYNVTHTISLYSKRGITAVISCVLLQAQLALAANLLGFDTADLLRLLSQRAVAVSEHSQISYTATAAQALEKRDNLARQL